MKHNKPALNDKNKNKPTSTTDKKYKPTSTADKNKFIFNPNITSKKQDESESESEHSNESDNTNNTKPPRIYFNEESNINNAKYQDIRRENKELLNLTKIYNRTETKNQQLKNRTFKEYSI